MKLWVDNNIIKNNYENLVVKGNFDEESYIKLSKKTEVALKSQKLKIFITQIGSAKIIENFISIIDSESGIFKISIGGGKPCSCIIDHKVKGNFNITMYRGSEVIIGSNTTSNGCEIFCDNSFLHIGQDCMISNQVIFQTSDQHAVINLDNGEFINDIGLGEYSGITIKKHVWIARRTTLVGNITIDNGSILGIGSILTSNVPSNCLYVGSPAKKIKDNVTWCRHASHLDEYVQEALK